jgi:hypothetical protein
MDLERDKLEADTSIDLMKVAADAKRDTNKEDSAEAMAILKENMAATREAMKNQTTERVAKSRNNGSRIQND